MCRASGSAHSVCALYIYTKDLDVVDRDTGKDQFEPVEGRESFKCSQSSRGLDRGGRLRPVSD